MKNKKLTYKYDPVNERLAYFEGERNMGGFTGRMATRQWIKLLEEGKDVILEDMEREPERKQKIKRLRAIWIAQGIDHMRHDIIAPYGAKSTADLTHEQLDELIERFTQPEVVSDEVRKLRSEALTILQKIGIYATNDDWERVNNYLLNPRIAGKMLYQMSGQELKALTRKLRAILDKQDKETRREVKLSMMN